MNDLARSNIDAQGWGLLPLTPEYLEGEHSGYVTAIKAALADDQIRNIALSGNYGVGKSSILRELSKRLDGRVVELSLSTLAPIESSELDESIPLQAATPTNRIQQEIVKQLLYREDPSKTPASRFRRIERFRWGRESSTAAVLGFVVAVVFLLTGWTAQIATTFTALDDLGVWTHLIVWGTAAAMALLVRWRFYGKLRIKQFSAGAATVTLDDNSVSYFDQYLDEIVYFFDVSDRDVVIFEDIDRFNDSHIFETLRALNTLLNASPQIEKPVRFIYAIKDSIFDRIGLEAEGRKFETSMMNDPAQAESVRANRTKFFDLVIPVVPFITHRSARNLAAQLLGKIDHNVAPELLDLAAQYVPDMRLLKNVRNEFIVFRDRIFSGDGKRLDLSETDLFAMMLYKSTHLTDFETIRLGTSKLETLYEISRELVSENIKRIEGDRRELRQRLSRIDGAATRSARLGERLLSHVQRTVQAVGFQAQHGTYSFAGSAKSLDDLKGAQFWSEFVSPGSASAIHWQSNYGQKLTFSRDSLAAALNDPLDIESWNEADRDVLIEQIDEKSGDIAALRSADLGALVKRPEFLVEYDGSKQSFEAIAKALLKPGLAYQLVRAGYINRNFTLYTSTFHGDRVSPAATNFIIHHVERDLMDEHFELNPDDADAVVRERGKSSLKEPALYNIAILDHLMATDVAAADIMIRSLVGIGDSQARFLQAYITAGKQRLQVVERFTAVSSRVLHYLVTQADLDDASRRELVDVALSRLPAQKQRIDAAVTGYLAAYYAEFTTLTSDSTEHDRAESIGALFANAGIVVPRLAPLSQQVRSSLVSRNLYEVTYENLAIVTGNTDTVALDMIQAVDGTVYDYVLGHLSTYLDVIDGASATVDASENFSSVVQDVVNQGSARFGDVIERAAPDCKVEDLTAVSEDAWPVLAEYRRFPATFGNVSRYVLALGSVDQQLAKVLTAAGEITEISVADEVSKTALAVAILAAREQLPSATLRTELVAGLSLGNYLGIDDVAAEAGDLFALLLRHNIIEDDAVSYEHLAMTDWSTRKAFIRESTMFANYMTPALVQSDLAMLLVSDEVNQATKHMIVDQAVAYVDVAGPQGLNELARFAAKSGRTLLPDVVQKMAQGGVPALQIVQLLEPHLGVIGVDQLFAILLAIGDDYANLVAVGYDKPKIPNTVANRALLERLEQDGIVSSYDERSTEIKVNKKHK